MTTFEAPAEIGTIIYYVSGTINRVLSGKVIGFEYNSLTGQGIVPVVNSEDIIDGRATYPVSKFYFAKEEAAERLAALQESFPVLTTIKKLDQKNRLHIPAKYLELVGIEENSEVLITCDSRQRAVFLSALDK